jgi:ABC-type antimicrobial peptide transport system permease subunit
VARTAGDPGAAIPLLLEAVWRVDPDMPITEVNTLQALVDESTADSRYRTLLILVLGALAPLIAAVGIFGVTARAVTRRTREMGIRMALGARDRALILRVMRQSMTLAAAGIGVGIMAAAGAARLLDHLLFGVRTADPATYGSVVVVLILVCTLAGLVPSLRVARMAPAEVLREE